MQIVTAIDLTKSQENVENSSIRFERLKGKNLGYPQRCAHSLQNYHTTQTSTPDRIGRVKKKQHGNT